MWQIGRRVMVYYDMKHWTAFECNVLSYSLVSRSNVQTSDVRAKIYFLTDSRYLRL
jgi:hypothetical protein